MSAAAPATTPATANPQRVIASFGDYAAAQRAVDYLSDEKFAVEHVALVGRGLKFVEQVTGRLNWGRAALNGLLSGTSTGLFIGLLLALFFPEMEIGADGVLEPAGFNCVACCCSARRSGAVFGLIFGLIAYAMTGGKRDFTSVGAMRAETYDLLVDADHADEAERVLAGMPAAGVVSGAGRRRSSQVALVQVVPKGVRRRDDDRPRQGRPDSGGAAGAGAERAPASGADAPKASACEQGNGRSGAARSGASGRCASLPPAPAIRAEESSGSQPAPVARRVIRRSGSPLCSATALAAL